MTLLYLVTSHYRTPYTYGGDYGVNAPSDGNFNINGLIHADRETLHPALAEVKYVYQYIQFELIDKEKNIFKITNRFDFTDLSDYEITYSVCKNIEVLRTKILDCNIKPKKSMLVSIDISDLVPEIATEYFINFSVKTKVDLPLIPKGHEVAKEQFQLDIENKEAPISMQDSGPDLSVYESDGKIYVKSSKVEFVFERARSSVISYKVDGYEYDFCNDEFGFRPNFWRGPTDNDYGNGMPSRQQAWKEMTNNLYVGNLEYSLFEGNKRAEIYVRYDLYNWRTYEVVYHIMSTGVVSVRCYYKCPGGAEWLIDIPRLGLKFRTNKKLHNVQYFGRGPEENYIDRKASTQVGHFKSTAEDMYFPYVRPQENGHHTDVRWFSIQEDGEKGKGLLFASESTFEFNTLRNCVSDFDDEDQTQLEYQWKNFDDCFHTGEPPQHNEWEAHNILRRQHHIDDIQFQDYVEVNVDYKMMGLAGLDSWGDQPDDVIYSDGEYYLGFTMIPINNSEEIPEKVKYRYQ
ncbi:hypothetical protein TRFO_25885 [Tritrichomonas foetus]|uniref:beta-galactosidase n=1 Tax=Tritrichomonas foetus TaxID=1144522 RepID=A0A1J4K930_9EUKA|nr:hypothetical protein TRFO_25885 [Tritrichomonas foetus]|eukprot:OHT06182.1 hypothetical protein TRFO_25885 [Tritrichomonas foetus]